MLHKLNLTFFAKQNYKIVYEIGIIEAPVAVYVFELAKKLLRLGESLLEPLKYNLSYMLSSPENSS